MAPFTTARAEELTYYSNTVERDVSLMLSFARYTPESAARHKDITRHLLCPSLGPKPSLASPFRSAVTTDGTPVEYSFSFSPGYPSKATVRLSIEPDATGPDAGSASTSLDLLQCTRADAAAKLLPTFLSICDMSWFYVLRSRLCVDTTDLDEAAATALLHTVKHKSQIVYGFDLAHSGRSAAKAYFLPDLRVAQLGQTSWQVVRGAVQALANCKVSSSPELEASLLGQLEILEGHLRHHSQAIEKIFKFMAVDLVRPEQARIKFYCRCPYTSSFDDIWDFLTLGDRVLYTIEQRSAVRSLLKAVTIPVKASVAADATETTCPYPFDKTFFCYFVLKAGYTVPQSKLFIRVQAPFATDDATVAAGFSEWMREQGWWSADGADGERYQRLLQDMLRHRQLEDGTGQHCWIAVSVKDGKLTVETYLSPELYKRMALEK